MAKQLSDIGDEWPFDHNKPGVEDLYDEVVINGKYQNIKDSDVCFISYLNDYFSKTHETK